MEFKLGLSLVMVVNVKVEILLLFLDFETRISIKYDHKSRSVGFYKNGIFQGTAFRNVPSGLTPSLDIWFESGTVEILKNTSVQEKIYL